MIENSSRTKPGTCSVMLLPRTDDRLACERGHTHFIVFTHACGYYSRAATISLVDLQVRLLLEGGYYSGCGFYSNKYGSQPGCYLWG